MDFEKFVINALEDIRETQNKTLVQTTKTNGRVDRIEKWQDFVHRVIWGIVVCIAAVIGFYIQHYISKQ